MTDTHTLIPMGVGEPETFRERIYAAPEDPEAERKRREFVARLAGDGVIDCQAYDPWIAALQARGWIDDQPELEPNPAGPGRIGRWRLNSTGRAAWAAMQT